MVSLPPGPPGEPLGPRRRASEPCASKSPRRPQSNAASPGGAAAYSPGRQPRGWGYNLTTSPERAAADQREAGSGLLIGDVGSEVVDGGGVRLGVCVADFALVIDHDLHQV